jgi:hypothetical protein
MTIFPIERSISMKGLSVRRKQIPICPAFCLTDYKVQGSTLSSAILDLKNDPSRRGQDTHRKYCSLYVQLSRLNLFGASTYPKRLRLRIFVFHPTQICSWSWRDSVIYKRKRWPPGLYRSDWLALLHINIHNA